MDRRQATDRRTDDVSVDRQIGRQTNQICSFDMMVVRAFSCLILIPLLCRVDRNYSKNA